MVPTPPQLAMRTTGGALMGLGARLLPGGNDALILVGLPFLLLHAWVGFVAMVMTIAASLAVARLMRSGGSTA